MDNGNLVVVAFGGNALISADEHGTHQQQLAKAQRAGEIVADLVLEGYRVLVVHGNGPQVGRELIRSESALIRLPPVPLDVCVAATQGQMGYLLTIAIRNALATRKLNSTVVSLQTNVIVNPHDPAFENPTKAVGPYFNDWRATSIDSNQKWQAQKQPDGRWRRVVPSPKPIDIIEIKSIETLVKNNTIVIAGGGGGTAIIADDDGGYVGVEGVIDKDFTASLLATHLEADYLVIITEVSNAYLDYRSDNQRSIERVGLREMKRYLDEYDFGAGSMAPKLHAAVDFVEQGGRCAVITNFDKLSAALADRAGTRIVADDPNDQFDLFSKD